MFIQVCTKQRSTRFNRILSVWLQVSARSVLRWEPDGTNGEPVLWVTFAFVLGLFDSRCGAAVWFVGFPQRGSRPVRSVSLEEQSCRKPKRDAGEGGGSVTVRRRSCGTEAIRWGVNPAGPHVCGVKIIALFVQWLTEKMRQAASRNSIQPRLILILHGYSSPVQVSAAFPETNFRICLQVTDLSYRVRLSTVAAVRRTQTQPLRNLQLLCSVWWGGTFTRFRGMLRRERGSALRVEAAHNVV